MTTVSRVFQFFTGPPFKLLLTRQGFHKTDRYFHPAFTWEKSSQEDAEQLTAELRTDMTLLRAELLATGSALGYFSSPVPLNYTLHLWFTTGAGSLLRVTCPASCLEAAEVFIHCARGKSVQPAFTLQPSSWGIHHRIRDSRKIRPADSIFRRNIVFYNSS